tara:strand:+ start:373 stop:666 length:294 start_codon:yes stop_codon:yes gene_type:complete
MGIGNVAICNFCDNEITFLWGSGIEQYINKYYSCKKCFFIKNFQVSLSKNKIHRRKFCPKCYFEMTEIKEEDVEKITCHKCRKGKLKFSNSIVIMWD